MPYGDGSRVPDRMMQIEAGLLPATLNGPFRSAAHDCDVSERESAEKLHIDDLGEIRLDLGELFERIADFLERL